MSLLGRRGSLSLHFVLGRRTITVTIPSFVVMLILLAAGVGYVVATLGHLPQGREIATLRQQNRELEHSLHKERAELKRVAELAEARSLELWNELEDRREEVSELWGLLAQLDTRPRVRRPPLAARAGRHLRTRSVHSQFSELQVQVTDSGSELDQLRTAALAYRQTRLEEARALRSRRTPAGVPCVGEMTSPFGPRVHPIYGVGRAHNGCDFTTSHGTEIFATGEGTVATSDRLGGYGQVVEIDHGFGLRTLYAHCSELKVKKGQRVHRGEPIATVGMTGLASGPHCHYEVQKDGKPVDPKDYLRAEPAPDLPRLLNVATWSRWLKTSGLL